MVRGAAERYNHPLPVQEVRVAVANGTLSMMRHWRWPLWLLCVALWTAALLRKEPQEFNRRVVVPAIRLPVSKFLHVGAYAFLTAFAGILPMKRRRWLLLVFLSVHAMATEYLQTFVPMRTGSWRDVGLNHLGIALGLALTWRCWIAGKNTQ